MYKRQAYFDHWVKEELAKIVMKRFGVKIYYYRYMEDMVILCADKEALHFVLDMMGLYLEMCIRDRRYSKTESNYIVVALISWL